MGRPIIPPQVSAAEAVSGIPNGAAIALSGFGLTCLAQTLSKALTVRFEKEGAPRDITAIHAAGHAEGLGVDMLATKKGLLKRIIGGHWGGTPAVREGGANEWFEQHNWPQGVIIGAYRAAAGSEKGLRSPIGLNTYIDPRQIGGCLNESARKAGSMIKLEKDCDGEEVLFYAPLRPDYAFLRGWKADRLGNISICWEPLNIGLEHIAIATRNNGGHVICQVREIEDRVFGPEEVHLPGFLVDAIVVTEDHEIEHRHSPSYAFESKLVQACMLSEVNAHEMDAVRLWIGRRAAMAVEAGDLLNLGIGIPGDAVPPALKELGMMDKVIPTLESGIIGGHGAGLKDFGVAFGPSARISESTMFDIYHGGSLDICMMGMAETEASGNINVSQFAGRNVGCGGFIDITQSARRIVFCSTFNGRGFAGTFEDGRIRIQSEGKQSKFVPKVQIISFSAQHALDHHRDVLLVTERAVFHLVPGGWELIEIAPGIDLDREIFAQMSFRPKVSPQLKTMNPRIFQNILYP